jgi:outer membrane protein TolC
MKFHAAALLLTSAALTGCAAPRAQGPKQAWPTHYVRDIPSVRSPLGQSWWRGFDNRALNHLIAAAQAHSPNQADANPQV